MSDALTGGRWVVHRGIQRWVWDYPRLAELDWGDPTERAQCGTEPGYFKHRNRKETSCQPCRDAHNQGDRKRRARVALLKAHPPMWMALGYTRPNEMRWRTRDSA